MKKWIRELLYRWVVALREPPPPPPPLITVRLVTLCGCSREWKVKEHPGHTYYVALPGQMTASTWFSGSEDLQYTGPLPRRKFNLTVVDYWYTTAGVRVSMRPAKLTYEEERIGE